MAFLILAGSLLPAGVWSESIPIPNGSFESPATSFVEINIDSWQKPPKPEGYDESGGFLWNQLTGLFRNTEPGDPRRIVNCDGDQATWLFAVPGVGLFQESSPGESSGFDVRYTPGKAYELKVGVVGGGGGMQPGVTLELSLYFRDASSNRVRVAALTVAHDPALLGEVKQLTDFTVRVPTVQPDDPWAGEHLGIALLSTVQPELQGGYWELDNVRLAETPAPVLTEAGVSHGAFGFTVESEPGLVFEVLGSPDLTLPLAEWSQRGTLTNTTGRGWFSEETGDPTMRFYQVRQLP